MFEKVRKNLVQPPIIGGVQTQAPAVKNIPLHQAYARVVNKFKKEVDDSGYAKLVVELSSKLEMLIKEDEFEFTHEQVPQILDEFKKEIRSELEKLTPEALETAFFEEDYNPLWNQFVRRFNKMSRNMKVKNSM